MTQFNARWFFPLWLVSLACGVGLLIFAGLPWFSTIFFPLGYLALLCALFTTIHVWHDWLNPLSLIVSIGLIRFTIAGILLCFTEPDIPIFHIMGLQREHWLYGHALALIGLLSVTIGWFIIAGIDDTRLFQKPIRLTPELSGGVLYAAIVSMSVGLLALFVFIKSNTSISITETANTGVFRSTQIQEGTGKFFFLSFMLISSSVVFVDYLFSRKHAWWVALLPTTVAMMALFVLGGRLRSLTAMAAGLLVFRAYRENAKTPLRTIICLVSIVVLLPIVFAAGAAYRGGQGMEGVQQTLSMSSILAYIQYSVWMDFGHLHALAAAVAIGPGVLEGRTFLALLWPLGKIIALPGKSAGVLMAQMLVGLGDRKWGFHATLIGDAYLNFGLMGVIVVTVIFAMILKIIYIGFRERLIGNAWYALSVIYSLAIFFESVEKYGEALTVLVFVFAIIKIGHLFSKIALAKESSERAMPVDTEPYRFHNLQM